MSFMDKLKFWKKSDPYGLDDLNLGSTSTAPPLGTQPVADPFAQQANDYGMAQTGGFGQQQNFGAQPFGQQMNTGFEVQPVQGANNFAGGAQGGSVEKDLEIISAKLDALKSALESINQRLTNLERIAQGEQQQHPQNKRNWY